MFIPRNTTPFVNWVWEYIWVLPDSRYKMSDLPHIALESEALQANPNAKEERYYIEYVILGDAGDVFVHMDNPILN